MPNVESKTRSNMPCEISIPDLLNKDKLKIKYDLSKPNGMKRKKLDLSIANKYGWRAKTNLNDAFKKVYSEYLKLK